MRYCLWNFATHFNNCSLTPLLLIVKHQQTPSNILGSSHPRCYLGLQLYNSSIYSQPQLAEKIRHWVLGAAVASVQRSACCFDWQGVLRPLPALGKHSLPGSVRTLLRMSPPVTESFDLSLLTKVLYSHLHLMFIITFPKLLSSILKICKKFLRVFIRVK